MIDSVTTIYDLMDEYPPTQKDKDLIKKAYDFAQKAHEGQLRQSGDPYFSHAVETAKNLARFGMDATTIAAGLMHDVIEDTPTTEEEMEKEFGKTIVFLVNGVTKLGKLKYHGRERHVESLRKFLIAVAEDFRILMIKLSDRLHNLRTLQYVPKEKQKRIALEALDVYAPLAHRLGIGKLKGELEDAAFPYVYPKEYKEVTGILDKKVKITDEHLADIETELKKELEKENIKVIKISPRMKHKYSLWRKLQRHEMDIDKIYDIMAIRMIVPTIENCYHALGVIHGLWRPLPNRIKDYIALPKLNGYQSLHTTVFTGEGTIIEIQIRTPEMHGRAEYGIASHFAYKEAIEKKRTDDTHKKFKWVDQFKEMGQNELKPNDFFKVLERDFFTDRIFVFTPEGDVIDLPEDSSPIDFAFTIHSEIGNHAQGAKVNGKMSPLSKKLKNSDIVEIVTSKNAHPSAKWLDFAKTGLARKHIRQYVDVHGTFYDNIMKRFK